MSRLIILLTVICIVFCKESKVEKAFHDNGITPDILADLPKDDVDVKYEKSKKEVKLGNEIAPKDVKEQPKVSYDSDDHSYYTLLMVDPDAPSRKNAIRRSWQHWLVVNVPGDNVSKGEVVADYVGAGPPKDTGLHRYVFLVFKQPGKLNFTEPHHTNKDGKRGNFDTKKFISKYNLGHPTAGNFFQAQFDDSVPSLHAQFTN